MEFARAYYEHYPKIGLGHWPPVFYVVQAAWYLVVPPGLVTGLWLMAGIVAATAVALGREVARFSPTLALPVSLLWIVLPTTRNFAGRILAEHLVVLLAFLAVAAYARYLDEPSWRWSILFALWASLTILTKGTGLGLALVPPLAVVFTGRWQLLRQPTFWAPALLVAVLCLPWYLLAPGARHENVAAYGGLQVSQARFTEAIEFVREMFPLPLWPAVAAAFALLALRLRQWPAGACSVALVVAMLAGTIGVSVWETRHMITVGPALLLVLAFVLHHQTARWQARRWLQAAGIALWLAVVVICLRADRPIYRVLSDPREAAEIVVGKSPIFVVGWPDLQGSLIAEIALRERRPTTTILRGDKTIAVSDFMGRGSQLRIGSPEQLQTFFDEKKVQFVVIDEVMGQHLAEIPLTRSTVTRFATVWERVPLQTTRFTLWRRRASTS
jgi:hypothetical protein